MSRDDEAREAPLCPECHGDGAAVGAPQPGLASTTKIMGLVFLGLLGVLGTLTACDDDGKAETDLSEDLVVLHTAETDVIVNSDGFPNLSHTCWETVGFWTTTDRVAIIVYNDHLCPGASTEQDMTVISGNPRDVVGAGGE